MEQQLAAERVLDKLNDYAVNRRLDVSRGLETAELAGLLVQKYGYGLCDAFWLIYRRENGTVVLPGHGPGPTYTDVDRVVAAIDPDWRETAEKRWESKAGLDLDTPRKE